MNQHYLILTFTEQYQSNFTYTKLLVFNLRKHFSCGWDEAQSTKAQIISKESNRIAGSEWMNVTDWKAYRYDTFGSESFSNGLD
jgi:hypothetical protein